MRNAFVTKAAAVAAERTALGEAWDARQKALEMAAELAKFKEDQAQVLAWIRQRREAVDATEVAGTVAAVNAQIKKNSEQKVRRPRLWQQRRQHATAYRYSA